MISTKTILALLVSSAFAAENSLRPGKLLAESSDNDRLAQLTIPTLIYKSDGLLADERLPEDVDFSEGGWATDFAASIAGLLFLVSALLFYPKEKNNFGYMHLGTCLAHLFGGLAHRYFANRASDGVGHRGFYVSMLIGYSGNCLRYGLGWGIHPLFGKIAAANVLYLLAAGIHVIYKMEHTTDLVDNATGMNHGPDLFFGAGEAFCFVMEVVASIYFVVTKVGLGVSFEKLLYYVAVGANVIGWVAVYVFGFLYITFGMDYDPSFMQRIFHFAMIIMLWSIDAAVRKGSSALRCPCQEHPHQGPPCTCRHAQEEDTESSMCVDDEHPLRPQKTTIDANDTDRTEDWSSSSSSEGDSASWDV